MRNQLDTTPTICSTGAENASVPLCRAFHPGMNNEFWIFYKTKRRFEMVIDIYDENYMKRPREERFSELKAMLSNDIMKVSCVHIIWENDGYSLDMKKSWLPIERIVKVHHLMESVYTYLTPQTEKNQLFESGVLKFDESCDNSHIPHYKVLRKRNKHKPGHPYKKEDGEVYIIIYDVERRVCELVWEAFQGDIPQGFRVSHIDGDKQNNRLDNLKLVEE